MSYEKFTSISAYFIIILASATECRCREILTPHRGYPIKRTDLPLSDFPLQDLVDFKQVFSIAGNVFTKIVGNIVSSKKVLGLNNEEYVKNI